MSKKLINWQIIFNIEERMHKKHYIMLQNLRKVQDYLEIEEAKYEELGVPTPQQVTEALNIIRGGK